MCHSTADAREALFEVIRRRYACALPSQHPKRASYRGDKFRDRSSSNSRFPDKTSTGLSHLAAFQRSTGSAIVTSLQNLDQSKGDAVDELCVHSPWLSSLCSSSSKNPWRNWKGNVNAHRSTSKLQAPLSRNLESIELQDDAPSLISDCSSETSSADMDFDILLSLDWIPSQAEHALMTFYKDLWDESDKNFDSFINMDACEETRKLDTDSR